MLCYKGISYSLSRLRFRFATSAVSVDVLYGFNSTLKLSIFIEIGNGMLIPNDSFLSLYALT